MSIVFSVDLRGEIDEIPKISQIHVRINLDCLLSIVIDSVCNATTSTTTIIAISSHVTLIDHTTAKTATSIAVTFPVAP